MNNQEEILSNLSDLFGKMLLLNKPMLEADLPDVKLTEVETIEIIANTELTNVTKISEALHITRGAASKITKKLQSKGYIESYQKPENKKEIYFRLTARGQEIEAAHQKHHQNVMKRDEKIFDQMSETDGQIILDFVKCYKEHLDQELKK